MAFEYYDLLWVERAASADEIKRAFRKKAMECHPDRHKGDKEKEAEFKKINEAYSVLSDVQKKAHYDRFGSAEWTSGFWWGGGFSQGFDVDFGDIFESFFGGGFSQGKRWQRRDIGEDIEILVRISLEEAIRWTTKTLSFKKRILCKDCKWSGAKDGKYSECSTCHGTGQVRHRTQTVFWVMEQAAPCHVCGWTGQQSVEKCTTCHGKKYEDISCKKDVEVPPGIESNMSIKMRWEGHEGKDGNGDLFVTFEVPEKEAWFTRDGSTLHYTVNITPPEAVLGIKKNIDLPVLGKKTINIDAWTQHDTIMRFRSEGMEIVWRWTKGDLLLHIAVITPQKLSSDEKKLYEALLECQSWKKMEKSFWENLF